MLRRAEYNQEVFIINVYSNYQMITQFLSTVKVILSITKCKTYLGTIVVSILKVSCAV